MPRFELRIAPGAMAEIRAISRWWRANRLLAPRLFDRELDAMLELLEHQPMLGATPATTVPRGSRPRAAPRSWDWEADGASTQWVTAPVSNRGLARTRLPTG